MIDDINQSIVAENFFEYEMCSVIVQLLISLLTSDVDDIWVKI